MSYGRLIIAEDSNSPTGFTFYAVILHCKNTSSPYVEIM